MPSQFGSNRSIAKQVSVEEKFKEIVSFLDNRMNKRFIRCSVCQVPMDKAKKEKVLWCSKLLCPKTQQRFPTDVQRVKLLGEVL